MDDDLVILPGATEWYVGQFRHPNKVMFHYTSRAAFESILKDRSMWAMDLRTMNDPQELLYGRELIHKRLKKAAHRFRNKLLDAWIDATRQQFEAFVAKGSATFSISFSEHRDLPKQWRDYAADGTGFVLGWSIDSDYPGTPLKTWVCYDRLEQKRLIDGLIDFHIQGMFKLARETGNSEKAFIRSAYSLFRFINAIWLTFKDASWSEEAEFRYVYHVFKEHLPDWCEILTRPDSRRQYISADFRPAELQYVGIGPKNDANTRRWVEDILRAHRFRDIHVEYSSLPAL